MYWDEVFAATKTGGAETERQSELMLLFAREEMYDGERLRVNIVTEVCFTMFNRESQQHYCSKQPTFYYPSICKTCTD